MRETKAVLANLRWDVLVGHGWWARSTRHEAAGVLQRLDQQWLGPVARQQDAKSEQRDQDEPGVNHLVLQLLGDRIHSAPHGNDGCRRNRSAAAAAPSLVTRPGRAARNAGDCSFTWSSSSSARTVRGSPYAESICSSGVCSGADTSNSPSSGWVFSGSYL